MPRIVSSSFVSVVHRFPSLSTVNPCGCANSPTPKPLRSLPAGLNSRIGGLASPRLRHVASPLGLSLKQRWKTQILPSGARCTLMTSPHLCPLGPFILAGSVGQSGTRRYGFGSVDGLGYGASRRPWACAATARAATTTAPTASVAPTRPAGGILDLHRRSIPC